jgi:hypothetical protein
VSLDAWMRHGGGSGSGACLLHLHPCLALFSEDGLLPGTLRSSPLGILGSRGRDSRGVGTLLCLSLLLLLLPLDLSLAVLLRCAGAHPKRGPLSLVVGV